MKHDELVAFLGSLNIPAENVEGVALQMKKRAEQLMAKRGQSQEEALQYLIGLLKQGWTSRQKPPLQPWKILSSEILHDYRIFKSRADRVISPRTNESHEMYVLEGPHWVNVFALTREKQVVLVQQYRHGTREITWEIPGGMIDNREGPALAASRELFEETGFAGDPPKLLGKIRPNPAFQSNCCYTMLIENARRIADPQPDDTEDIVIQLVDEEEFGRMICDGRIDHALIAVADLWRRLWRSGSIQPVAL